MISGNLREICENYYYRYNPAIRSDQTRRQYTFALNDLAEALGHPPTVADLTDDSISAMLAHLTRKRLKPKTINERAGRVLALWRWLYQRREVDRWPTPQAVPVPRKTPIAWTRTELDKLLAECGRCPGFVGHVPASWWWVSLHLVMWDSGERISALLSCRWEWLSEKWLVIPAEVRKGQTEDRTYELSPQALESLEIIRRPRREQVWPWPYSQPWLWIRYKEIRESAGLATDRQSAFHRMRRSVASHFEAAGGNATELLGHSDRRLTKQSYLDPRFCKSPQAVDKLFRLDPPRDQTPPPGSS